MDNKTATMSPDPWTGPSMPVQAWRSAQSALDERVDGLLGTWLENRRRGQKQPVMDFLFEYYSFRPAHLRRYSPGLGVRLEGEEAREAFSRRHWAPVPGGVALDPSSVAPRRARALTWMRSLLYETWRREPYLGCYGMHEWAMVYRTQEVRHGQLPLRMEPEALASFVDSRPVRCSHYDAFRFFTPEARPLNRLQPTPEAMTELEQPGCLHANMDLYRWGYKLFPWIGSDLLLDTFALAIEARHLDMRASPYDLRDHGLAPIQVETPQGRAQYRQRQEALWERAQPLRARLIEALDALLAQIPSA
jgi:hypothetical protein